MLTQLKESVRIWCTNFIAQLIEDADTNYNSFLKEVKDFTQREDHRNALENVNFKKLPSLTNYQNFVKINTSKPKNLKMKNLMSDQAFSKFK